MPKTTKGFVVTHAKDAQFERDLRSFFNYRDLELKQATQGRMTVSVIRAAGGKELMLKQRAPAAA